MSELQAFEVADGVGMFRPVGTLHLRQATLLVSRGIARARELGLGKLLVVTTRLEGFKSPSIAARVQMVREWAEAADGQVTIAMVARRNFIDREKFGTIAAAYFGLTSNVFDSEAEAIAWLREY